jgi:hypothetical protein
MGNFDVCGAGSCILFGIFAIRTPLRERFENVCIGLHPKHNGERNMKKAIDCDRDLAEFLDDYQYQPNLTETLDSVGSDPFGQVLIDKIVLWKVNRYAPLSSETLEALNSVVHLELGSHKSAHDVITALLQEPGVDLPMASTFLRFRNPGTFQIIDRHAYRAVYGDDYPLFSGSKDEAKIDLYFRYLDDLVELARTKKLEFRTLDRVLYIFDKQINGKL